MDSSNVTNHNIEVNILALRILAHLSHPLQHEAKISNVAMSPASPPAEPSKHPPASVTKPEIPVPRHHNLGASMPCPETTRKEPREIVYTFTELTSTQVKIIMRRHTQPKHLRGYRDMAGKHGLEAERNEEPEKTKEKNTRRPISPPTEEKQHFQRVPTFRRTAPPNEHTPPAPPTPKTQRSPNPAKATTKERRRTTKPNTKTTQPTSNQNIIANTQKQNPIQQAKQNPTTPKYVPPPPRKNTSILPNPPNTSNEASKRPSKREEKEQRSIHDMFDDVNLSSSSDSEPEWEKVCGELDEKWDVVYSLDF
ncbi:hypothetical protein BDW02DRAFT_339491 [Decorospora gaudefroyi]|uniref:Uncharacterized protein n=1 Tax=Decorospora gaudefroyi TaxID=184978 RepID=A0A6A5KFB5_9PLEO|nr:hypothetical protein BDW02DRAFT_339491 [Decorospora gaudefroyi]